MGTNRELRLKQNSEDTDAVVRGLKMNSENFVPVNLKKKIEHHITLKLELCTNNICAIYFYTVFFVRITRCRVLQENYGSRYNICIKTKADWAESAQTRYCQTSKPFRVLSFKLRCISLEIRLVEWRPPLKHGVQVCCTKK